MRAVVQRVSEASVTVDGQVVGSIDEPGLLVLVGVTHDDSPAHAERLAAKLWGLRILPAVPRPEAGAENADTAGNRTPAEDTVPARSSEVSCSDVAAPLLVVSQFTLYADTRKGRRPSWSAAAPGPVAEPLVKHVVTALRKLGARVETGVFGAQMRVSLVNNGPVTLIVEV